MPIRENRRSRKNSFPVAGENKNACDDSTGERSNESHEQRVFAEVGAIYYELGIEEHGAHHEGGEPVFPHAFCTEGGRNGNRAVHAQGRDDSQNAGRHEAEKPQPFALEHSKESMYPCFGEDRNQGSQNDSHQPVWQDLPGLNAEIEPEIH